MAGIIKRNQRHYILAVELFAYFVPVAIGTFVYFAFLAIG